MQVRTTRLQEEDAKIIYQETAGLAIITIHRPQLKNALTANMWSQLAKIALQTLDNPKNKVLILRGSGENFTAGSDIKEFNSISLEQAEEAFVHMEQTISTIERLPIPVIGVINGPAMGAGLELALACDIRIGSEKARMGIPVGKLGITLNNKFAKRLVDLVGPSATKDFVFTGRMYKAEEAFNTGMLNYLVAEKDLNKFAIRMGKLVAGMSPSSLLAVKRSVQECVDSAPVLWKTSTPFVDPNDFPEGVRSFVEKRQPKFNRK
ncbi:enoyl-CoA hydratase/isomerase family protein [Ureibacillus chungkukjangi]|uniref:Enoyl-CoA hydratase/carnithine racemase n=1 Tax=Ureibacillus chungkukjangi TaxID=1202712 RepID=A0A318TUW6_9BACL|nr:enoyl-CoA hydratase/isomerase family protein [Ureibacillus chungkukjangi]MCM3387811.1 enoyl-CoA hydratase/isomerase family protein [Ureibacillus chungkukjangi]PYF05715.1 enoyl-CoA hydratase/carnithine racemase [Ureibacillus chungkukjangi]